MEALNRGYPREAGSAGPTRGEDIQIELELRSFEAERGTCRPVMFAAAVRCIACMGRGSASLPDPDCEYCHGSGTKRSISHLILGEGDELEPCTACVTDPCPRCGGEGTVPAGRRLRLQVPPGVEDGTRLRVRGEGDDAGAGSEPGDLLVDVHVLPPPRDARGVRYVAFALLLVALVTLVLYVVR
jgi:molecular chaperone DnaJ